MQSNTGDIAHDAETGMRQQQLLKAQNTKANMHQTRVTLQPMLKQACDSREIMTKHRPLPTHPFHCVKQSQKTLSYLAGHVL